MTTSCTPAASAVRKQAPRLCGSWIPSSTRINGVSSIESRMLSNWLSGATLLPLKPAMTPWCRCWSDNLSNSESGHLMTLVPDSWASASTSISRLLLLSASTRNHPTSPAAVFRAEVTAWMPISKCSSEGFIYSTSSKSIFRSSRLTARTRTFTLSASWNTWPLRSPFMRCATGSKW